MHPTSAGKATTHRYEAIERQPNYELTLMLIMCRRVLRLLAYSGQQGTAKDPVNKVGEVACDLSGGNTSAVVEPEGDMMDGNVRRRLAWAQRPKWGTMFLMSMLIVTILICGATSACSQNPTPTQGTSSAAESDHVPAYPDDCWGGALSADPLHCYVIDQAHQDGVIEVEGVYDDEGGSLYIYINYLRPVEDWLYAELRGFLIEKGNEFAENQPDHVSYDLDIHLCGSPNSGYASYEECIIASTFVDDYIIPWASPYDRIWLRAGGAQSPLQDGRLGVVDAGVAHR